MTPDIRTLALCLDAIAVIFLALSIRRRAQAKNLHKQADAAIDVLTAERCRHRAAAMATCGTTLSAFASVTFFSAAIILHIWNEQ